MDATEILGVLDPVKLFGSEAGEARIRFRKLVTQWHPDINPDARASDVLRHITVLRDRLLAGDKVADRPGRDFTRSDGGAFRLRPLSSNVADFGEILTCERSISMIFNPDLSDLADIEAAVSGMFTFADDRMKAEVERQLTGHLRRTDLGDGRVMITLPRNPNEILLSDLIARNIPAPPRQIGWIGSRLFGIATYLEWAGIRHGGIGPDTLVIDVSRHMARLAFGWALATRRDERPVALPARTLNLLPRLRAAPQDISSKDDRDLVRLTLRELAAHSIRNGAEPLPAAITAWLNGVPQETALKDLQSWTHVIEECWGKRRFTVWDISLSEIMG